MYDLLVPKGKLVGLLFNFDFSASGPPFGGSQSEYEKLFSPLFKIKSMNLCYNSVAPRSGNELFFIIEKL
jgi:thiopurine S-methyltransferase